MPSIKLHNKEKDQIYTLSTPDTNDATTITFPKISGSLALQAEGVNQTITIGEKYKTVTDAINYIQTNQVCNYTIVVPENYNWEKLNINSINIGLTFTSNNKDTTVTFEKSEDFKNKSNQLWANEGSDGTFTRAVFLFSNCSTIIFDRIKINMDLKNQNVNNDATHLFYFNWSTNVQLINSTFTLINHVNSTGTGTYANKRLKLKNDFTEDTGILFYILLASESISSLFISNSNINGWDMGINVLYTNLYLNNNTITVGNYVITAARQSKIFLYRTNTFNINDDSRYQTVFYNVFDGTWVSEGNWGSSVYKTSSNGTSRLFSIEPINKSTTDNTNVQLHKLTI